jgi:hypothetical protein
MIFVDVEDAHRLAIRNLMQRKVPTPKETREISDALLVKMITFAAFAKAIGLSTEAETV